MTTEFPPKTTSGALPSRLFSKLDIGKDELEIRIGARQTLWTIGERFAPAKGRDRGTEIRHYLYKIRAMNDLESNSLHAGQVIALPVTRGASQAVKVACAIQKVLRIRANADPRIPVLDYGNIRLSDLPDGKLLAELPEVGGNLTRGMIVTPPSSPKDRYEIETGF